MTKRIKKIERALMILYKEIQDLFPEMHCLNLSVSQTAPKKPPYIYGYIHIGDECYSLARITNLIVMVEAKIEKNRVLYHSFDGLKRVLK